MDLKITKMMQVEHRLLATMSALERTINVPTYLDFIKTMERQGWRQYPISDTPGEDFHREVKKNRDRYPTWSEHLEIAKSLGWRSLYA